MQSHLRLTFRYFRHLCLRFRQQYRHYLCLRCLLFWQIKRPLKCHGYRALRRLSFLVIQCQLKSEFCSNFILDHRHCSSKTISYSPLIRPNFGHRLYHFIDPKHWFAIFHIQARRKTTTDWNASITYTSRWSSSKTASGQSYGPAFRSARSLPTQYGQTRHG